MRGVPVVKIGIEWVMLGLLFVFVGSLGAQIPNDASQVYQTADRPRALALIGDRYHSPVYIRDALAKAFVRENVPITFIQDHQLLTAKRLEKYDLLVFLKDGMIWPDGYDQDHVKWMKRHQEQAIWDFVNGGGGFLALHNSHGLYPPDGPYYELFGGDYGGHPPPAKFTVRVEDPEHPITRGVEDFQIFDEQHMSEFYLERKHLLLRSISPANEEAPAGWWRKLGEGRFAYLAPGHTVEALNHPAMQRLIRNAVHWLLEE